MSGPGLYTGPFHQGRFASRQGLAKEMEPFFMYKWKSLLLKHRKILLYILCSVATAGLETGMGWLLIHFLGVEIVYANTAAILIGAVVHYLLTLALVFELRQNVQSAVGYMVTFGIGLLLQNAIIWFCYEVLFGGASSFWRFAVSKGISLVIPFFLTYYLRTVINQHVKKRRRDTDEKSSSDASLLQ